MADSTAPTISPRFALREATSEAHERLDARLSTFDLTDTDDYGAFLLAQAGAFLPMEAALEAAGVSAVIDDWPDRRRSELLRADLAGLGLAEPKAVPAPALSSEADILGALYVLEGSRLGGAILIRKTRNGLPKSFLTPGNPADWRAFVKFLEQRLSSQTDLDQAALSAAATFEAFASSASAILEKTGRD